MKNLENASLCVFPSFSLSAWLTMTPDTIELRVSLTRENGLALLAILDQRLSFLQYVERADGEESWTRWAAAQQEKGGIIPVMMALEEALRAKSAVAH